MEIWKIKRRNKTADLVQEFYKYAEEKCGEHIQIYTDGSKEQLTGATGYGGSQVSVHSVKKNIRSFKCICTCICSGTMCNTNSNRMGGGQGGQEDNNM